MKTALRLLCIELALLAGVHQAAAQGTKFFRISGPAATTITAFRPDGTMVWSNAQPGVTYTIQAVPSLPGATNWVDYVQIPTTDSLLTNRLIDYHAPAGMVLIPSGVFMMGDNLDHDLFTPSISMTVSAFYMDTNLVSYSQWQSVYDWATNRGYGFHYAGSGKAANHPVQTVDWYDVVKWSNARSQQAGQTPVYYTDEGLTQVYTNGEAAPFVNWTASGYRLPTEAEWEKAARGGLSGQRFPWGNLISESLANYTGTTSGYSYDLGPDGYNPAFTNGGFPYTSPVGYFAPNGYGLYDMAGNAVEWCWDWGGSPYAGGTDPRGPASGVVRAARGGFWDVGASLARCALRGASLPATGGWGIGFRCVRGL